MRVTGAYRDERPDSETRSPRSLEDANESNLREWLREIVSFPPVTILKVEIPDPTAAGARAILIRFIMSLRPLD